MASATKQTHITPEEYFTCERVARYKSEDRDGRIYAMAGASRSYNLVAANLARHLGNRVDGRACELYIADMKVCVQRT